MRRAGEGVAAARKRKACLPHCDVAVLLRYSLRPRTSWQGFGQVPA
jgi:hypothetical protein